MWTQDGGFGAPGDPSNQSLIVPNAVFYKTANILGFDRSETQKLFLSFIFLSIIISFGVFSSLISKNYFVRICGLVTYLFNFYMVTSIGYSAKTLQMILIPLIFFLTIRFLKTKDIKYILLSYISLYIFQGVFTNLPTAAVSLSSYFFALLYYLFCEKNKNLKITLRNFLFLLIPIVPIITHHGIIYTTVVSAMKDMPTYFSFTAIGAPLSLLFQLRGVWWEKSGHLGVNYFSLWSFYGNLFVVASTIVAVGAIIIYSIKTTWSNKLESKTRTAYWLFFYLFGLGLSSGLYFLPGFYSWLMNHLPFMIMFREPWAKFIPLVVFSFSALVLVLLDYLARFDRRGFVVVSLLLVTHLLVQSYPFVSGKIIDGEVVGWKRRLVKIPEYWEQYSHWTKNNQGVILPIPFGVTPFNSFYDWYGNSIGNSILPMPCILAKTNVICDNVFDKYVTILKKSLDKHSFEILTNGGVDFILIQEDLKITSNNELFDWQKEDVQKYIESKPTATFGNKLKLYRVIEKYRKPKIYIISSNSSTPSSSFVQLSQADYSVSIPKVSTPFTLVFNQAFNKEWKITNKDNANRFEARHFIVNGFGNGWEVDPKLACKQLPCDINLSVNFMPQKYFSKSTMINTFFLLISSISIVAIAINKLLRKP